MIARLWTARAEAKNVQKYRDHFTSHVVPVLHGIEGFLSASLMLRPDLGDVEILVETRWRSLDSIRAFAGSDLERAVVADEAAELFSSWDERVRHYVVETDDVFQSSP